MKVGQYTSNSITPNVGAPQGCVPESPALLSLQLCPLTDPHLLSNLLMILWFWASSPTMMRPHTWMRWRDLHHGARTTVSLWMWAKLRADCGLQKETPAALHSSYDQWDPCGESKQLQGPHLCRYFVLEGVNISENLTWTTHIQTQVKKARQRLYHLRQLRKFRSLQQSWKLSIQGP